MNCDFLYTQTVKLANHIKPTLATGLATAHERRHTVGEIKILHRIIRACDELGQGVPRHSYEILYCYALHLFAERKNEKQLAIYHDKLGFIYMQHGDDEQAHEHFNAALVIAQRVQQHETIGSSTSFLRVMAQDAYHLRETVRLMNEEMVYEREYGDEEHVEELEAEMQRFQESLANFPVANAREGWSSEKEADYILMSRDARECVIARLMRHHARQLQQQADVEAALWYYQTALRMMEQSEDDFYTSAIHDALGTIYRERGDYTRALEHFRAALAIVRRVGFDPRHGVSLPQLLFETANTCAAMGDKAAAIVYYEDALKNIGGSLKVDFLRHATIYYQLATLNAALHGYSPAIEEQLQQCILLATHVDHPELSVYQAFADRIRSDSS